MSSSPPFFQADGSPADGERGAIPRDPTEEVSSQEVRAWLQQASACEVQAALASAGVKWKLLIAQGARREQLSAEVLWMLLQEQGGREGLAVNPAFQEAQVALLMEGAADELERYDRSWRERQELPTEEEVYRGRVKSFEILMEDGQLPEMRGEHPSLVRFLEVLAVKDSGSYVGIARFHLAAALLEQKNIAFTEAQLEAMGRAFAGDFTVMGLVIRRARTAEPIRALLEGIEPGERRIWASEVIHGSSELIRQESVRSLVRPWAEGGSLQRLFQVEFEECGAEAYVEVLARYAERFPAAAARAFAKVPPPAGVVLPRELIARLLMEGSPEERLSLIRSLESLEVSYLAPSAPSPPKPSSGQGRKRR